MTRRLLLTTSAAAWLAGIYLLYAQLVSPVGEPTQLTAQEPQLVSPWPASEDLRPVLQDACGFAYKMTSQSQSNVKATGDTIHERTSSKTSQRD